VLIIDQSYDRLADRMIFRAKFPAMIVVVACFITTVAACKDSAVFVSIYLGSFAIIVLPGLIVLPK
jgi:hypothetical protein